MNVSMNWETQTEVRRLVGLGDRCMDSATAAPTGPSAAGLAAMATAYYAKAQLVAQIGMRQL